MAAPGANAATWPTRLPYHPRDRKYVRKHFPTAEGGRAMARRAAQRRRLGRRGRRARSRWTRRRRSCSRGCATTPMNRSGRPYRPWTIRRYAELALRLHIQPTLGHCRLSDVDRAQVKALVRDWTRAKQNPSSIRNNLDPLRVIFREAIEDGNKGVLIGTYGGTKAATGSWQARTRSGSHGGAGAH